MCGFCRVTTHGWNFLEVKLSVPQKRELKKAVQNRNKLPLREPLPPLIAQVCSGACLHQLGHRARTFPALTGSGSAKGNPWRHSLAVALSEWCGKGHHHPGFLQKKHILDLWLPSFEDWSRSPLTGARHHCAPLQSTFYNHLARCLNLAWKMALGWV